MYVRAELGAKKLFPGVNFDCHRFMLINYLLNRDEMDRFRNFSSAEPNLLGSTRINLV